MYFLIIQNLETYVPIPECRIIRVSIPIVLFIISTFNPSGFFPQQYKRMPTTSEKDLAPRKKDY